MRGDLGTAVQQRKRESGKGPFVGRVKLPLALTELGLKLGLIDIDEYEFWCSPGLRVVSGRPLDDVRETVDSDIGWLRINCLLP